MTKRVRGTAGDGGSGVGGELDGMADEKFFGVQESRIVEIKKYVGDHHFYRTVQVPIPVAAIIHDLARVYKNPSCSKNSLNILKVVSCIMKVAQIRVLSESIDEGFLVEFTKRHPLKLDDFPGSLFPLELKSSKDPRFMGLKEQIEKQGRECYRELEEKITRNHERHVQDVAEHHAHGRQRQDLDIIQPYLAEDDVPQEDDCTVALKNRLAEVVAEFAPSNGKFMDAKGEATKSALITFLKVQLQKLEPAQKQREGFKELAGLKDGELFFNPHVPQV